MGEKEKDEEWGGCQAKHRSWERGGDQERGKQKRGKGAMEIQSNPGFIFGQTELKRDKLRRK